MTQCHPCLAAAGSEAAVAVGDMVFVGLHLGSPSPSPCAEFLCWSLAEVTSQRVLHELGLGRGEYKQDQVFVPTPVLSGPACPRQLTPAGPAEMSTQLWGCRGFLPTHWTCRREDLGSEGAEEMMQR